MDDQQLGALQKELALIQERSSCGIFSIHAVTRYFEAVVDPHKIRAIEISKD